MNSACWISSCVLVARVGAQPTELDVALINIALFAPVLSLRNMCQARVLFAADMYVYLLMMIYCASFPFLFSLLMTIFTNMYTLSPEELYDNDTM